MTFFDFAYKNITRDFKTYLYYFINCVFSVFVFFLFAVLSFHPTLKIIDNNSTMGLVLMVAEFISISFALVFITYSVSNFLKGRSRQFGLLTILGSSKKQLNRLISLENIMIGMCSIVTGIGIGLVFSKLFLSFAGKMIGELDLQFYFPGMAIGLTMLILGVVFLIISCMVPKFIRKQQIISLLKTEDMGDKKPRMLPVYTFFLAGFIVSILTKDKMSNMGILQTLMLLLYVVVMVLGTYILYNTGIRLYMYTLKRTEKFYKRTKMLSVSNMKSSIKASLQSMTLSTILYTIAFLSIILMVSSAENVENETRKIMPYAFMYSGWTEDTPVKEHVGTIEQAIGKLPNYKFMECEFSYYGEDNRRAILSQNQYNEIAEFLDYQPIQLSENEVYLVAGSVKEIVKAIPEIVEEAARKQGVNLVIKGHSEQLLTLSGYLKSTTVVSNEMFKQLKPSLNQHFIYAFDVDGWTEYKEVSLKLKEVFQPMIDAREATLISAYSYYESSKLEKNLILYIGSILCFSFILAVASFIYSRLYTTMSKECEKYKGIVKIGLAKQELSKVLKSFVRMILLVPYMIALLYMWIGVLIIDRYSIISNVKTAVSCTIIYTIVQWVVYIAIYKAYQRDIFKGVYGE